MSTESRAERQGWLSGIGFVAPLALVWIVPILVLLLVAPRAGQAERSNLAPQVPEVMSVGSRMAATDRPTTVSVAFAAPADVVVRRAGVVTGVDVAPGGPIAEGDALVTVDGVPVIAFAGEVPMYRDLGRGDKGLDVQALGEYLVRLGLMSASGVDERFGAVMEAGVRRFEADILRVVPTGRFSVGYVAFVPATAATAKSVAVAEGQDVSVGAVAFTVSGPPISVSFLAPDTGQALDPSGPVTLLVGTKSIDLAAIPAPAADTERIYALLSGGVTAGVVTKGQPNSQGGDPSARSDSTEVFNGVSLGGPESGEIGTVAATAVWTTMTGTSCVFVAESGRYTSRTLGAVELVRGQLGVVAVPGDLVGQQVVRNPGALEGSVLKTCASM